MIISEITCDKVLAKTSIEIADYVINPYKGCQYGCLYCYVKKNKSFKKNREDWGNFVIVKRNCITVLEKELEKIQTKRVLIGSVTEPYQQVEQKYLLTRKVLKVLNRHHIAAVILTKSDLILRDIDVLKKDVSHKVCFTVNMLDEEIKEIFEKDSSIIASRLAAVSKLYESGVRVYIHIGPIFPLLVDIFEIMKQLKGITPELVLESFNFKMGEGEEVHRIIRNSFPDKYEAFKEIFSNEKTYYNYWNNLKDKIIFYNKEFNYKLTFFFRPFNVFYNTP